MSNLLLICRILKYSGWLLIALGTMLIILGLNKSGLFKDGRWMFWKKAEPAPEEQEPTMQLLPDPRAERLKTILSSRTAPHDGWTESATGGEIIIEH